MVQTVDDVVSSEADIEMTKAYPSEPGWDSFYGYGRINAAAAVEALVAQEIPPSVSVDAPAWYAIFDAAQTPEIAIEARISARTETFSYVVEVGIGHQPSGLDWPGQRGGQRTHRWCDCRPSIRPAPSRPRYPSPRSTRASSSASIA